MRQLLFVKQKLLEQQKFFVLRVHYCPIVLGNHCSRYVSQPGLELGFKDSVGAVSIHLQFQMLLNSVRVQLHILLIVIRYRSNLWSLSFDSQPLSFQDSHFRLKRLNLVMRLHLVTAESVLRHRNNWWSTSEDWRDLRREPSSLTLFYLSSGHLVACRIFVYRRVDLNRHRHAVACRRVVRSNQLVVLF